MARIHVICMIYTDNYNNSYKRYYKISIHVYWQHICPTGPVTCRVPRLPHSLYCAPCGPRCVPRCYVHCTGYVWNCTARVGVWEDEKEDVTTGTSPAAVTPKLLLWRGSGWHWSERGWSTNCCRCIHAAMFSYLKYSNFYNIELLRFIILGQQHLSDHV